MIEIIDVPEHAPHAFDTLSVGDVIYDVKFHVVNIDRPLNGPFTVTRMARGESIDTFELDLKDEVSGEEWEIWFCTVKSFKNHSDDIKYNHIKELCDVK